MTTRIKKSLVHWLLLLFNFPRTYPCQHYKSFTSDDATEKGVFLQSLLLKNKAQISKKKKKNVGQYFLFAFKATWENSGTFEQKN